jgi:hypothetical protein
MDIRIIKKTNKEFIYKNVNQVQIIPDETQDYEGILTIKKGANGALTETIKKWMLKTVSNEMLIEEFKGRGGTIN